MKQQTIKHLPALAVTSALFALGVGLTSAGLITGGAIPRLLSGDTQASAAPRQDEVQTPQSGHQALSELERSLQRLSAPKTHNEPHDHRASPERVQWMLSESSAGRTDRLAVETGPRIAGRIDRPATQGGAAAFIASVAVDLTRIGHDLGVAAPRKDTPKIGVAMLDTALQRFDRVSGPVASDTFARVYLGLSEMVPKLSDSVAYHQSVPKADLRAQVIEARTAASLAAYPTLTTAGPLTTQIHRQTITAPRLLDEMLTGDTAMLDAAPMEIAGLTAPVEQLALGAMTAAPKDLGSALPYDEAQLALDDIDIDALGDTGLASLESPVDAEQLQETRAGFVLDNGVQIDFNVTRLTVIEELGQPALNLTNMPQGLNQASLSRVTAGQEGNTRVMTQTQGMAAFSVVQNSLDNQAIYDITTINVDIKNLGLQSLDFVPESLRSDAVPAVLK